MVCTRPDNLGVAFVDVVPRMQSEINVLMSYQRDRVRGTRSLELCDQAREDKRGGGWSSGGTSQSELTRAIAPDRSHICLIRALWQLGIPVRSFASGPFWALRGGNRFLAPFKYALKSLRLDAVCQGSYMVCREGHCVAARVGVDSALVLDGDASQHSISINAIVGGFDCSVYQLTPFAGVSLQCCKCRPTQWADAR